MNYIDGILNILLIGLVDVGGYVWFLEFQYTILIDGVGLQELTIVVNEVGGIWSIDGLDLGGELEAGISECHSEWFDYVHI